MERSQQQPWIQVIGRIAVHLTGSESHEPTGASRVLLSILVAAGPDGASIEDIADAYWTQSRPTSWKIALRISASHLGAQLPDGWDVSARGDQFQLIPGHGFIDAWRVEEIVASGDNETPGLGWLNSGTAFGGIEGIDIIDASVSRLTPMIQELSNRTTAEDPPGQRHPFSGSDEEVAQWMRGLRRSIVLASPNQHAVVANAAAADAITETHVVVGDRRLFLSLGPFAVTFPELRNEIRLHPGLVEQGSAARSFRVVADALALRAADRPQRLMIANAHELDTKSLELTSLLIDRGRLSDFSMIVSADNNCRDLRWLDFLRRSVTAGCEIIEYDPA